MEEFAAEIQSLTHLEALELELSYEGFIASCELAGFFFDYDLPQQPEVTSPRKRKKQGKKENNLTLIDTQNLGIFF